MKHSFTLFLLSIVYISCAIDRNIPMLDADELLELEQFFLLSPEHQTMIASKEEPGRRLWLGLTIVDKATGDVIPNQRVHLYHTDTSGSYSPRIESDESTARLSGDAMTDENGRVFVRTILPGDYGSSADNRHIHTTVFGAKPEAYDIHFKQFTGKMGKRFINGSDQHFLADLKQNMDSILVSFVKLAVKNPKSKRALQSKLPECQWCGANEAPERLNWKTTITDKSELGQRITLEGTIYETDGITPAAGVIVYAYHTNNNGIYEKKGNETGNGQRHGYLRAWVKTNNSGQYQFNTIKPAPYPNGKEPPHVHLTLMREDFDEYWILSTLFEGDDLLGEDTHTDQNRMGGFSNIVPLNKDESGDWVARRDIILNPMIQ